MMEKIAVKVTCVTQVTNKDMDMKPWHMLYMALPVSLFLSACKPIVIIPPPITKYHCLVAPSAAYQAGAIIRTVSGTTVGAAENVDPDSLTTAWLPTDNVSFNGNFADFERELKRGLSAGAATGALKNNGVSINLSGDATYSISLKAIDNKIYVADDTLRLSTATKLQNASGILPGARYFFIKEAIGSSNLTYEVKKKFSVEGKAEHAASLSSLSANITAVDANNKVHSSKELIACVLIEELAVQVVSGASGADELIITPKGSVNDAAAIDKLSTVPNIK